MKLVIIILSLICVAFLRSYAQQICNSDTWDYGRCGPDAWPNVIAACAGDRQSPINLYNKVCIPNENLDRIVFKNYSLSDTWTRVENSNGITFNLDSSRVNKSCISGSDFGSSVFCLIQFQFHWGLNKYQGSEHTVDNKKFPVELQLVHQNPVTKQFAVIGFLFDIGLTTSSGLSSVFGSIRGEDPAFNLDLLVSNYNDKYHSYYRYMGSFTSPPCTESVVWTVFRKRLTISQEDYEAVFSSAPSDPHANFRPPVPLGTRKLFCSVDCSNYYDNFKYCSNKYTKPSSGYQKSPARYQSLSASATSSSNPLEDNIENDYKN